MLLAGLLAQNAGSQHQPQQRHLCTTWPSQNYGHDSLSKTAQHPCSRQQWVTRSTDCSHLLSDTDLTVPPFSILTVVRPPLMCLLISVQSVSHLFTLPSTVRSGDEAHFMCDDIAPLPSMFVSSCWLCQPHPASVPFTVCQQPQPPSSPERLQQGLWVQHRPWRLLPSFGGHAHE